MVIIVAKQSFIKGALVLVFAGSIVRVLGFLYQVVVVRLIGTEGIGIFNMVFPLYIMALVITTAGLPLAISRLVSKSMSTNNVARVLQYFKYALVLLIIFSIISTTFLYLFAQEILSFMYDDGRVYYCFLAALPGLIIVATSSAFRGLFQGLQDMTPTAVGQCLEQIVRLSIGIFLIVKLKPLGITITVVGLSVAMIAGELVGFIYLFLLFKKKNIFKQAPGNKASSKEIVFDLVSFGAPVTVTRLIASIVYTIEATLIPKSLIQSGFTLNQATSLYGEFTGVALTLLSIPTILTNSLATSLVPTISEAEAQKHMITLETRSSEALNITFIFGLPAAFLLFWYGSDLSRVLFGVKEAGIYLQILSLGSLFLYLQQTTIGILQGLGAVNIILIHTTIGALIKFVGIYYLAIKYGLKGVAISFVITYSVVSFLNLLSVKKYTKATLFSKKSLLPIFALFIMIFSNILVFNTFMSTEKLLELLIILLSSLLIYFAILLFFNDPTIKQVSLILRKKI